MDTTLPVLGLLEKVCDQAEVCDLAPIFKVLGELG